jgi:hypothetical protein
MERSRTGPRRASVETDPGRGPLAEFLRSRRAAIRPNGGVEPGDVRRVRGLRRSEVARLAGVSVDYYARLEQGRQRTASSQVFDALAGALELSPEERAHLHSLGRGKLEKRASPAGTHVMPSTIRLLRTLGTTPAVLLGRGTSLLMMNGAARALFGDLTALPKSRRFAVAWMLEDEAAKSLHADWEDSCRQMIGILHHDADRYPSDPVVSALTRRLESSNEHFAAHWSEHHIARRVAERKTMLHPLAGRLELTVEAVSIVDAPEQHLYVLMPKWGAESSRRFAAIAEAAQ